MPVRSADPRVPCIPRPSAGPIAPGKLLTAALLLVGLLASAGLARAQPPGAQRAQPVEAAPVQKRAMPQGRQFVGTVEPLKTSTIGSAVEELVESFLVDEGDAVKEDDVLVELRIDAVAIQLKAAEAELRFRQKELDELENGSRQEEIDRAEAEVWAAAAVRDYAAQRLRRTEQLAEQRVITEEELQEKTSAAIAAERNFDAKLAAWLLVLAGPRDEKIEQARARVAMQTETVNHLKDEKARHTILAPFDGIVTREHTEVGQWVAKGDPVVELVDISKVLVEVPVLEDYVGRLRPGMKWIGVEVNALRGEELEPWVADKLRQGVIDAVVPQGDVRSRSFPVKVLYDNPVVDGRPLLAAGMLARVTLPVGDETEVLAVPKDALVLGEGEAKVWVVNPEAEPPKQVRPVPVQVGTASDERWIEVKGDLKEGELVITKGNERVVPVAPVKVERIVGRGPSE